MNKHLRLTLKLLGGAYCLLLLYLLFFAAFRNGTESSIKLVPFQSIIQFCKDVKWSTFGHWFVNVPGNILAFIPFAFILFLWYPKKLSKFQQNSIAVLVPIIIEISQYLSSRGQANVDDVLLNYVGFMIGFWLLTKKS